ncbi:MULTISPECIES: hypothetical protein [unclassified Mesorhizobium]|uniref:hypothetical protein n=1 Tax=unclassified Mesorhizobium TaxID=325217 RepID=UPI001093A927|nr:MULTISPECIES: hypothetical protein [unclassified Mesorhizobium]TGT90885.1 hypothetical protein EN804_05990 [Mesorhizobium sp. M8A.F.Ca.ET.161.01.1.1]TGV43835.1 hypothetical protein EN785_07555 [Mesorhizobium sp. M8A.F.Ca.ET.142.01.1.1]
MLRTSDVQTTWMIDWPLGPQKSYYATTYPNSELISLETSATRRPVSGLVGRKIMPQVRDAIERAGWKFAAPVKAARETAYMIVRHLQVGDEVVIGLYHQQANADARATRENDADGPNSKNVEVVPIEFEDERA